MRFSAPALLAVLGLILVACSARTPAPKTTGAIAAPPEALVQIVTTDMNRRLLQQGAYEEGDATPPGSGGKIPRAPAEMFTPIDINGDGARDWRVDMEHAPNPSFFCGSGGCLNQIYVSTPQGGHVLTFDETVGPDIAIATINGERTMDVEFHGSICNLAGAERCPRRYAWDPAGGRWLERPNVLGQTVLRGPLIQAPVTPFVLAPPEIRAEVTALQAACRAARGQMDSRDWAYQSIPDITGDGRRDWVVGAGVTCHDVPNNDDAPATPMTVWAANADGSAARLYSTTGASYAVDILNRPAELLVAREGAACGESRICDDERLKYDAAARTLVPVRR